MNTLYDRLLVSRSKYESSVDSLNAYIARASEGDYFIEYKESDGFVLVNYDLEFVAPLDSCLSIIEQKGTLSFDDFYSLTI